MSADRAPSAIAKGSVMAMLDDVTPAPAPSSDPAPIPALWRDLVWEINGHRPFDGEPGVRSVDAICEEFKPYGKPWENTKEFGVCDTDGHYLCSECVHIKLEVFRRRRDQCEHCGAALVSQPGPFGGREMSCPDGCDRDIRANVPTLSPIAEM